jgi:putative ATP-binding cassette transporter
MSLRENLPRHEVKRLFTPYWASPERKQGFVVLAILIAVTLATGGMVAWYSGFQKEFYDAIEKRDAAAFWRLSATMIGAAVVMAFIGAYEQWLRQWIQIRWRKALTYHLVQRWLSDNSFYRLERRQSVDNADQRISDDAKLFVENTLDLVMSFVGTMMVMLVMAVVLWTAATPLVIGPITIHGYLLWVAILFGVTNVASVHWAGHRLASLSMEQQRRDADFRFTLAQQRDAAEQIALYRGSEVEKKRLGSVFELVVFNWSLLMTNFKRMNTVQALMNTVMSLIPIYALAPKIFAGEATLGTMMQSQAAFLTVAAGVSWFASSYEKLVLWSSVTRRLIGLNRSIDEPEAQEILLQPSGDGRVNVSGLTLRLPNGQQLAQIGDWEFGGGQRWIVRGPSGVGKSTLLRAVAGIWPHGDGVIAMPERCTVLFLPQKSYIPTGTLKEALCYPASAAEHDDEACRIALRESRLPQLEGQLDQVARWQHRLSGGEQQRLAIARALLAKPDFLFMDEATSALDEDTEAALYELLDSRLEGTTIVSVAHHSALKKYHDHALELRSTSRAVQNKLPRESAPLHASLTPTAL